VVIDWGLAKLVQAGSDVSVTRGGSGTWTAPERDSGVNGPFTDVYSLGKILYYLATSEQPPVILSYVERDRMMAAGHPQWLADLMLRAAWPRHEERLQNVHMFAEGLANEGRIRQSSQDVAASDDFTTWG
jgi:serine/threonine protein kinase